ncbi:MAG: DUF6873 family GME fold protein [Ruminococcus sp.]
MQARILISPANSKLINSIKAMGIDVVESKCVTALRRNEQYHADMQALRINDRLFLAENCNYLSGEFISSSREIIRVETLEEKYPGNVLLNAVFIRNKLFCKVSAISKRVCDYCNAMGIELINVNQGYTKCSTLIVSDNAVITADETIYKAMSENRVRCLKIRAGYIKLQDADYGFIGGASGRVGDKILFFGDISKHPDCADIIGFIKSENAQYFVLSDEPLTDIGGLVEL